MEILDRHNVRQLGQGRDAMMFAHGFGCDQEVWRNLIPSFEATHRITLFDYVGSGKSDRASYKFSEYAALDRHAQDLIDLCVSQNQKDVILVAHSVSAMIGAIAAAQNPGIFKALIMVAPNPCYIDDGDYIGGFSRKDIDDLVDTLSLNFFSWARMMSPLIMGEKNNTNLSEDFANRLCLNDPDIACHFAKVTFLSDSRPVLSSLVTPTLILQCSEDVLAPLCVGRYLKKSIRHSVLHEMKATGHCPHLSAPDETSIVIKNFLAQLQH